MKHLINLKPLVAIIILCLATIAHAEAISTPVPLVFTEEQPNILLNSNQSTFTVKLKSNPTTGFSWFLREYDPAILTPVRRVYDAPDAKLMGAGGYERWIFKVKPAGFVVPQQTTIRFVYTRAWQGVESSTQVVFRVSTMTK